jgi:hypothetical protein
MGTVHVYELQQERTFQQCSKECHPSHPFLKTSNKGGQSAHACTLTDSFS